jgi:hypothetical protein
MLVAIDEIRRPAEQLGESRKLHHQFGADYFRIEPPGQTGAQQFRKGEELAAIDRLEMHRQRPERRRQCHVQADRATRALRGGRLQRTDFVAADRGSHHHHRCRIETAALDQLANGAVDAGTHAVIVGAQPEPSRRPGVVHSAADLASALLLRSGSIRFSLCSATK